MADSADLRFSSFDDPSDYQRCLARLAESPGRRAIAAELQGKLKGQPEVLLLGPTPRSALPGRAKASG
jgi:hypothetical protein